MSEKETYGAQAIAEDLENLNAPAAKPAGSPTSEARSLAKQGRKRVREPGGPQGAERVPPGEVSSRVYTPEAVVGVGVIA